MGNVFVNSDLWQNIETTVKRQMIVYHWITSILKSFQGNLSYSCIITDMHSKVLLYIENKVTIGSVVQESYLGDIIQRMVKLFPTYFNVLANAQPTQELVNISFGAETVYEYVFRCQLFKFSVMSSSPDFNTVLHTICYNSNNTKYFYFPRTSTANTEENMLENLVRSACDIDWDVLLQELNENLKIQQFLHQVNFIYFIKSSYQKKINKFIILVPNTF